MKKNLQDIDLQNFNIVSEWVKLEWSRIERKEMATDIEGLFQVIWKGKSFQGKLLVPAGPSKTVSFTIPVNSNRILYIGKARNIKKRLAAIFSSNTQTNSFLRRLSVFYYLRDCDKFGDMSTVTSKEFIQGHLDEIEKLVYFKYAKASPWQARHLLRTYGQALEKAPFNLEAER